MGLYLLYRLASVLAHLLPRRFSGWMARRVAFFWYYSKPKERAAVRNNLATIAGREDIPEAQVFEVFQNFGLYLVDFFRYSRLNARDINTLIRIEGLENMGAALRLNRGAIGLTAHLGNFELAGAVLTLLGMPVSAAVLIHQNPRINAFFVRQRDSVGVEGIPVQHGRMKGFMAAALGALRANRILALVGDRDMFNHGMELPLFGKSIRIPTGPAYFHLKTGAPIVPGFLVREPDGRYRFILEPALPPVPEGMPQEEAVRWLTKASLDVIARYVRQYPTQWYYFHEFWKPGPTFVI